MRIRRVTVCELGGASLSLPETEVFSSTAPLKCQSLWLPELQGRGSLSSWPEFRQWVSGY